MSSMSSREAERPNPRPFSGLCLALALGLVAHLLAHTFVNPHRMAAPGAPIGSRQGSAPSTPERWLATSNPDSISAPPSVLAAATPAGLIVFIASPILIPLCRRWPPPLHPPQFLITR